MADEATPATLEPVPAIASVASAVPLGIFPASGVSTPGGPGTGTVTPALSELPADQVEHSLKVSLADLCAKAAVLYSQQKNYEEASEVYARAAEMQAEMNGEMNPENAEILFLYGRALFKVGQGKSDVLGGKAPENTAATTKKPAASPKTDKPTDKPTTDKKSTPIAIQKDKTSTETTKEEAAALEAKKPLFQFTGDEEWDMSDDEDEAEGGDEDKDDDDDDDDLAVAFEVLDLSRVLFEKQLEEKDDKNKSDEANEANESNESNEKSKTDASDEAAAAEETKGKEVETKDDADAEDAEAKKAKSAVDSAKLAGGVRHIMERLADTHDLLAEISLENERYPNAIVDSRACLAYKKKFLPEESEIIAEAHFKLSLALEFASVTTSTEAGAADGAPKDQQVDQELRDEAARELEAAITSTKLKLQTKEVELATLHSPEDNDATRRQIAEVKDIISDMEQRLADLKKPPIDLNAAVNGPAAAAMGGLLGALGGPSKTGVVEEAKKTAKDLTGLVRKKAKDAAPPAAAAAAAAASPSEANGNGSKRKADDRLAEEEDVKKARTVDAA